MISIGSPADAANYFGKGNSYSEVVDPKSAVMNEETYKSDDVKAGVEGLAKLRGTVDSMKSAVSANKNADISSFLKGDFSALKLRTVLNKYNNAFSEDTQRGTDRLIRAVIQDATELERESQVKPGKDRSDTKLGNVQKRLDAAGAALAELADFYPK